MAEPKARAGDLLQQLEASRREAARLGEENEQLSQENGRLRLRIEEVEGERDRIERYLLGVLSSRPYLSTLWLRRLWRRLRGFRLR